MWLNICSLIRFASNATMHLFWQAIWEDIWKLTLEKSPTNATNVTMHLFWQFEKTFENSFWRKIFQMQPMRLCISSLRRFEKTFENSHWKKVVQMQPMRLCIFFGRQFEKTFENSRWKKVIEMQPLRLCIVLAFNLRRHLKTHSRENCSIATSATSRLFTQTIW